MKERKQDSTTGRMGIAILLLIFILAIPGLLAISAKQPFFAFAPGNVNAWIGFWGSYLGGIVGMVAVVFTTFILIKYQQKQHFELLEEQKNSIDEAAEINDRKTREREYKLFLIKINEELVESITNLTKLIKLRKEVFRKINNFGKELLSLTDQQNFLRTQQIIHEKEDSIHETILYLMKDIKASQFKETELFAEIEIEIAKVRILYTRLDLDKNEIENINSLISDNSKNMMDKINRDEYGDEYSRMLHEFDRDVTKIINNVLTIHIDKIKELFEAYKK